MIGSATRMVARLGRLTLVAAALLGSTACASLIPAGPDDCQIGAVDVSGTPTTHVYHYYLNCGGELRANVSAAYDVDTKRAEEKLQGDTGTVQATWSCPRDPWIRAAGDNFTCTPGARKADLKVSDSDYAALVSAPPGTEPYSSRYLTAANHHGLDAQLQNAIRAAQKQATPAKGTKILTSPATGVPSTAGKAPLPATPATPTGFTGTRDGGPGNRITLHWHDAADETYYYLTAFDGKDSKPLGFPLPAPAPKLPANANSFVVDGQTASVVGGVTFHLQACNAGGCSAPAKVTVP